MRWGRVASSAIAVGAACLLASCGLLGSSEEAVVGTDWSLVETTTSTSAPAPTTSRPSADSSAPPTSAVLRVSEQDLRAMRVCAAIADVQAAGVGFWQAYQSGDPGIVGAADGLNAAFSELAGVADPATSALLAPVVADLGRLTSAPDQATVRQAADEVMEQVGAPITAALAALQPLCPGQLQPETLDQAERVELAVPPPSD